MTLKDNLERACELAYEFYTGKCWHRLTKWNSQCWKCVKCMEYFRISNANPSLATSLDEWAKHMWPVINETLEGYRLYKGYLNDILLDKRTAFAEPLHHLEAALRAAMVECDRCDGTGEYCELDHSCSVEACDIARGYGDCPKCTCTNGRISLYQQLEGECDMNEDAKYQARLVAEDR